MTTTQRIAAFKDNQNPALVTLLVQFGRYLLIFSSQSVGQPANLQSIWANSLTPRHGTANTPSISIRK